MTLKKLILALAAASLTTTAFAHDIGVPHKHLKDGSISLTLEEAWNIYETEGDTTTCWTGKEFDGGADVSAKDKKAVYLLLKQKGLFTE